jgi:flagellar basal-body rod modification protein FlgD
MESIGALSNVAASSAVAKSETKIAETFDTFLSLLTTQLKHQDPLAPMDSTKFTEQLVQFSQVEQAITTNKNLETAIALLAAGSTANAVSYIGKEITAEGKVANLSNGKATWGYTLEGPAVNSSLTIRDSGSQIVFSSSTGEKALGNHEFIWDGKSTTGEQLPEGSYSLEITAIDGSGELVKTTTVASGLVTGVETNDGVPALLLGQTKIPLTSVLTIRQQQTANDDTTI